MVLAFIAKVDALAPLFPAPIQVLSQQMDSWFAFEDKEEAAIL